jgi:hypothetical protein
MWLSVVSIVLSIVMNSLVPEEVDPDDSDALMQGWVLWFDRAALQNKEFTNYRSWFHVFMVFFYTFLGINAVQKTRRDARISYQLYYSEMSKKQDFEWLKARTLHIKGIPYEDRAGTGLLKRLEEFLST